MQADGNLVLSAYRFADPGYWYTGIVQGEEDVKLLFNGSSAHMYLINSTGATIYLMPSRVPTPIGNYYHRATIDDSGNFQQYIYRKVNGNGWISVWQAITEPCTVNSVCGVYGFCTSPDNQTISCSCLQGYSPVDSMIPSKGCYPSIPPQQCNSVQARIEYKIEVIEDADLPNDYAGDLERIYYTSRENCTSAVLDDCYCMAATFVSGTCRKKRIPFMNARKSNPSTYGTTALIKVPINYPEEKKNGSRSRIVLIVVLSISAVLALFFAATAFYYHPIAQKCRLRKHFPLARMPEFRLRRFTYQEMREATEGFNKRIGRGSFGTVYCGILALEDRKVEIAVKVLEKKIEKGEKEFWTELKTISQMHHKHLVKLLGFCNEKAHRLLVYELMKNGSLSGMLFGEGGKPGWDFRARVAVEIARGLLYLHEECDTQIIHCDIKPQNVLLDEKYTAKIADLGLAKILMEDQTRTSTNARGTMGYMAPEWLKHAPVGPKVDVYSFGVMLLEIICGRRHIELNRIEEETEEDDLVLMDWVLSCVRLGRLHLVVENDDEVLNDFRRFERMAMVGLWCVHPDPTLRPTMKKVTQMLEGTIEVGVAPLACDKTL